MADTSAIDTALVGKLLADSTLMAITTDGVYLDIGPVGAKKFVVVSQLHHEDAYTLGIASGVSAFERVVYLVKVVALATSMADVKTAAARIHTLLQGGTLTITGYSLLSMRRTERLAQTEDDPEDPALHWQHRGGLYELYVQ